MQWSYPELRRKLIEAELWPQGRMARLACYLTALAAVLYALQLLLGLFALSWGDHLGGWVGFLAFVAAILFFILAFRWVKRRILWRLRNRLIVTYVFIGVIPAVLLIAMAGITLYGLGGQFAVFVITSEIHAQLRSLEAVNSAVTNELAARLERGDKPTAESLAGLRKRDPSWGRRRVCAWEGDKELVLGTETQADVTMPRFAKGSFREIVRDHDQLYLRVVSTVLLKSGQLTVVTSEPFDKELVGKIASTLGEITLYMSKIDTEEAPAKPDAKSGSSSDGLHASASTAPQRNQPIVIGNNASKQSPPVQEQFTVGALPEAANSLDHEIWFGSLLRVTDWKTGESEPQGVVLRVSTRPSVLYGQLFAALGSFIQGVTYILLGVAAFFAIIELIALIIGTRMTRTVTAAVAQLHDATKHVDRGDFSHRIPIRSDDQLADLALSFNSMTESIEKLILEQKEKQRLENELSIAQEVQAQLFPRQVSEL
ncbi:MAG: HAMP domain-containing protein, partial [Candidatus Sulfotelmatobacter sp.]